MLDFGFQNMVAVFYMPTVPGRHMTTCRHMATWVSGHFFQLHIETQITSSGALAYFCCRILDYPN